jgi:type I restriction enzyme, S subunit
VDEFGIPDSWLMLELGEVIEYGKTEKSDPKDIPDEAWILELEDVEKDTSKLLQKLTFSERKSKSTKNKFLPGDVLYGKLRPYLNKVIIADEKGYCTTEIIPIRSNQAVDGQFLFYWLKHPIFLEYVEAVSHGINMPRLGTEAGLQAPFILAPLNEQKRIADRLDHLLTHIDKAKAHLDRIPPLLKRFRQSVLAAATSGKLTEDWREANGNMQSVKVIQKTIQKKVSEDNSLPDIDLPESWAWTTAIQSCSQVVDCHNKTAPYTNDGIKLIRTSNIRNGRIDLEDTKFINQSTYEFWSKRCPPKPGDLIFTREAPMAEVGMIPDNEVICMGQRMMLLRVDVSFLLNYYLLFALQAPYVKIYSDQVAVGTGVKHLRVRDVDHLPIPLPPLKEQHEIVRRIEALFAKADRIEAQYQKARQAVDRLTPALLAKAFRGELVPQDPNDEPASVLLERIRGEKEGREKKEKGGKGRSKKS